MDHTPWRRMAGLAVGLSALLTLVLLAFAWPSSDIEPRDLPIAVVGPDQVADGIEAAAGDEAFALIRMGSREAAVDLIENRDAYGAVIASPGGTELLTASAASPTVATLLQQSVTEMASGAEQGAPTVTDVAPLPEDDPRGVVFNSGSLPLVLGGILTAVLVGTQVRGKRAALLTLAGVAILSGLALAGLLQGFFGALSGSYLANAGVVGLGLAAAATMIVGLKSWIGMPGIGLGAVLMMLVGNPLSGVTSAPELLPLGGLGQLLPPGAMGSALRSTAYFDGAGAGGPLAVLGIWLLAGVALVVTSPSARQSATNNAPTTATQTESPA